MRNFRKFCARFGVFVRGLSEFSAPGGLFWCGGGHFFRAPGVFSGAGGSNLVRNLVRWACAGSAHENFGKKKLNIFGNFRKIFGGNFKILAEILNILGNFWSIFRGSCAENVYSRAKNVGF